MNEIDRTTTETPDATALRSIMTPDPVTVPPAAPLSDVLTLMRQRNIGAVIVAEQDVPVGIFTERDLLRRTDPDVEASHRVFVRDVMTAGPWTVEADTDWQTALDVMQQRRIRHAPVVDHGVLVGMLSVRDIMKHRTALLESVVQRRTAELQQQKNIIEARDRERTHSLKIAGRIQRQLLPTQAPEFDPLSIAFEFHPHDEVAGDYFDFQTAGPDTLLLIVGDASGHGVPAAFISVIVKTHMQTRAPTTASPAALLSSMNELLYGWVEPEHFISMFVAAIDRRTLRMTYARAGHPRPLLVRPDGSIKQLDAGGIMIGVLEHPEFQEQSVQLATGDRVLLYTDGLPECPDSAGRLFGIDQIQEFLVEQRGLTCDELVSRLVERARVFAAEGRFADDLTAVLVEIRPPALP